MTAPLCREMEQEYRSVQQRADTVAAELGTGAVPRWLDGERLNEYRARVLQPLQQYSKSWRGVDISRLPSDALGAVERQVIAEAMREARAPTNVPAGTLREITTRDRTGRPVTKFYGDPEACWGVFKGPVRHVIGFRGS